MRRFWRTGRRDAGRADKLDERLAEAAEADDWATVLKLARRALKREPDHVRLLCFAAQARMSLAGEKDQIRAGREAAELLDSALQRSPRDATVLYLRGAAEELAERPNEALAFWRRAWQADPADSVIREALVRAFVSANKIPDWGVPATEATLLEAVDTPVAWPLLLGGYQTSGNLSEAGYRLCRQRFFEHGDRDAGLVTVLGRALVARKEYDEAAREVLEEIAARDGDEGRSARRVVVRCDANLGVFRAERVEWYREALEGGSLTAAFVLTRGALEGQLDHEPALAVEGVTRCLAEATLRQWEQAALDRARAVAWLAAYHLARPPANAGVPAVEAALEAESGNLVYLRWLADAYRPHLGARPVERYLSLFRLEPDNAENTHFLAGALIDRRLRVDESCEVLSAHLHLGSSDPVAARRMRAQEAVRLQRADPEALGWLQQALAEGDPSRELTGWLAVVQTRAGQLDDAVTWRAREVAFDPEMPRAWRAEVGLALARRLHAAGHRDGDLFRATWNALEPGTRPDWLAVALAPDLMEAGRTDAEVVPVYRTAYRLEPTPELARMLARAYLADRDTPLREKIDHWRACLAGGETDSDVLVALAQALASEGAATEAALHVVDEMPEAQRPRVLDELCRHRFRQGEYAAAETIASRLLRLRPDDAETAYRLNVCRVRRALRDGQPLPEIQGGEDQPKLANLARLVAAAAGREPADDAVAEAIERAEVHSPALHVAVGALRGLDPKVPPVETGIPRNTWLLATVEQAQGQTARARRRLQATEDPDLRLWERYLAARQALEEGRGAAACELLLPVLHRTGPPWDGPRELLAALAPRYAPPELLARLTPLLSDHEQHLAHLRVLLQRALAGDDEATRQIAAAAADAPSERLRALPLALLAAQASSAFAADDFEQFAERLAQLQAAGDEPDRSGWFAALLAHERGDDNVAYETVFHLSDEARATPALAAEVASWYLSDGSVSRAEAVLSHALRHHRENVDLLSAVATLNAQLGRTDKFLALVPVILRHLPADDPRADTLALLRDVLERPLAELDAAALIGPLAALPPAAANLRLGLLFGHVTDRIRRGEAAGLLTQLPDQLAALAALELPPEAQPVLDELTNALAYAHLLRGEVDAAEAVLAALEAPGWVVGHNRAVVAEEAVERGQGDEAARLQAAATLREQAAEAMIRAPFDEVGPGYREAVLFAAHQLIATHYRRLERWPDELRHLERCIEFRPYDIAIQRASLQPLLSMGEGDRALHKSQWLLQQQPDDLEVQLDHATVLASVRGVSEALAWLEQLVLRHPEAQEVVRQRREELRDKLQETAQRRAEASDYVGTFAAARDAELLAENPAQRARALLQQAYALSQMAGDDQAALLEQALAKCQEVLELTGSSDRSRHRATALAEQASTRLGPLLARQAEELFLHRRREYYTLSEQAAARPPDGAMLARGLALAFERVADLYRRASEYGGKELARNVQPRVDEAEQLARRCRQLEATLSTSR